MKTILYGTTALVTLSLVAGGAMAQQAPATKGAPIQLQLGGEFNAAYVIGDQDDARLTNSAGGLTNQPGFNRRDDLLFRQGEVWIQGSAGLDNGLKAGVVVELEAESCSDQIDESFIHFGHDSFGKVEAGATNGAAYKTAYGAPSATGFLGVNDPAAIFANAGSNAVVSPITNINLSGDADKISYYTPSLYGLRFGGSYTPDACEQGTTGGTVNGACASTSFPASVSANASIAQQIEDVWELGTSFEREVQGVTLGASLGYLSATAKGITPGATGAQARTGGDGRFGNDPEQWSLGGKLGFKGLTLGGAYKESENLSTDGDGVLAAAAGAAAAASSLTLGGVEREDWNLGATYDWGPITLGAAYAEGEVTYSNAASATANGGLVAKESLDMVELSANYKLAPGVNLVGAFQNQDFDAERRAGVADNNAALIGRRNEANVFLLGTRLTF